MIVPFVGRLLARSRHPLVTDRCCPACGGGLAADERFIATRGMRFHQRCAGYRTRQVGSPKTPS